MKMKRFSEEQSVRILRKAEAAGLSASPVEAIGRPDRGRGVQTAGYFGADLVPLEEEVWADERAGCASSARVGQGEHAAQADCGGTRSGN